MFSFRVKCWTDVFVLLNLFIRVSTLKVAVNVDNADNPQRRHNSEPIRNYNVPPTQREESDEPDDLGLESMRAEEQESIPHIIKKSHDAEEIPDKQSLRMPSIPVDTGVILRDGSHDRLRDRHKDHTLMMEDSKEEESEPKQKGVHDSGEDIKLLLEEKYKFRNDETSTRYKITNDDREYPVFPETQDERQIAWAFRSYAVRRIVGGMETSISMYPYNVAISRNGKHWCGGSIIDEQWVLTAGHCLESAVDGDKKKLVPFIIRAGSSFHNRGGYQARVNKVFFPTEYVPGSADYDFSLLRLDRPMPIGRNIAVLNLPSKDYIMKEEDILIVTGWGSTDESGYGHIPDRLRFVPVPVMRLDDCQKSYRFYITPRMLCAGYATGGKDACNHDSGGPAVRDGVLLGIVSFGGKQCGDPRSPGVYSRVSEITDWVERTITNNEASAVPELKEKIQKARMREKELQKFKARVEDKKNKIKNWLRETLKSPTFIELAKKKLKQAGFTVQKSFRRTDVNYSAHLLDDRTMDEINLSNQINDRIIEADGENNEAEKLIGTLALQEVMMSRGSAEKADIVFHSYDPDSDREREKGNSEVSIETLIAYVTEQ